MRLSFKWISEEAEGGVDENFPELNVFIAFYMNLDAREMPCFNNCFIDIWVEEPCIFISVLKSYLHGTFSLPYHRATSQIFISVISLQAMLCWLLVKWTNLYSVLFVHIHYLPCVSIKKLICPWMSSLFVVMKINIW